jgi:hypothetical protein
MALSASPSFSESVDINHFLTAPSINGCGGFIKNQSALVLNDSDYSLGIHKFIIKFNYGFKNIFEAGAAIDFGISSAFLEIMKTTAFNFKAKLLTENENFVDAAAGIEKFPVNIFENVPHDDFRIYGVVSRKISDMNITLGLKKQLDAGNFNLSDWGFSANISKVIGDTTLAMLEFDQRTFNAGVKISFNKNLSVDFSVLGLEKIFKAGEMGNFIRNYFVFGITYCK